MKQTIAILSALTALLLLATGFIVVANYDLGQTLQTRERELHKIRRELEQQTQELNRRTQEKAASAETLRKAMQECDELNRQLDAALLASQEATSAVEQQIRKNEKQLQELQFLSSEYEDLSQTCDALEAQVAQLSQEAVQSAMRQEAQSMADAKRIAELEAALQSALAPTPAPVPASTPAPVPAFSPLPKEKQDRTLR